MSHGPHILMVEDDERLAVSSRTLQRRQPDEGNNFKAVVRETRKSLSQHYLRKTQLC
jgi:hypothetical protein